MLVVAIVNKRLGLIFFHFFRTDPISSKAGPFLLEVIPHMVHQSNFLEISIPLLIMIIFVGVVDYLDKNDAVSNTASNYLFKD